MRDRNYFPEFVATWEGRAGMWLRKGTDADAEKAAKSLPDYTIFRFAAEERDPLGKARAAVIKDAQRLDIEREKGKRT
jgi:hypothetical protein